MATVNGVDVAMMVHAFDRNVLFGPLLALDALQLDFKGRTEKEVFDIVRSLREEDPEIWVRYWSRGTMFIINCLVLQPGEEKILVERFSKVFA